MSGHSAVRNPAWSGRALPSVGRYFSVSSPPPIKHSIKTSIFKKCVCISFMMETKTQQYEKLWLGTNQCLYNASATWIRKGTNLPSGDEYCFGASCAVMRLLRILSTFCVWAWVLRSTKCTRGWLFDARNVAVSVIRHFSRLSSFTTVNSVWIFCMTIGTNVARRARLKKAWEMPKRDLAMVLKLVISQP